ncbi:MAG TPA: F0F1 ATP synthase subunit beta, partial [Candidatus Competibacter sp.]|nr:F0F1 ATP synthase subunit beta [Candidatus Competibacter sp.]
MTAALTPASPCAAEYAGRVIAVRGSVVDMRFPGALPPLRQRLLAGPRAEVVLEVSEHLAVD